MKVLHINTFDNGGAGKACVRLHEALLRRGIESKLLTVTKSNANVNNHYSIYGNESNSYLSALSYLENKFFNRYRKWRIQKVPKTIKKARQNRQFECVSIPQTEFNISGHPLVEEADIIHLHWVSDFVDFETFFEKVPQTNRLDGA